MDSRDVNKFAVCDLNFFKVNPFNIEGGVLRRQSVDISCGRRMKYRP